MTYFSIVDLNIFHYIWIGLLKYQSSITIYGYFFLFVCLLFVVTFGHCKVMLERSHIMLGLKAL